MTDRHNAVLVTSTKDLYDKSIPRYLDHLIPPARIHTFLVMYLSSAPLKAPAPVTSSSTTEPDPNTELQPESASALPSFAPDFLPPLQTTNSTGPRVPSPSFQTAGQLWNQNHLKMACFEEAKQASIALSKDESSTEKAHELHLLDLYKTQKSYQGPIPDDASILILVKFPDHISARSCQSTDFQTGKLYVHPQTIS